MYFTQLSYTVEEGNEMEICVQTDTELKIPVSLILTTGKRLLASYYWWQFC